MWVHRVGGAGAPSCLCPNLNLPGAPAWAEHLSRDKAKAGRSLSCFYLLSPGSHTFYSPSNSKPCSLLNTPRIHLFTPLPRCSLHAATLPAAKWYCHLSPSHGPGVASHSRVSPRVTDQGQTQTLLSFLHLLGLLAGGRTQDTGLVLSTCCGPGSSMHIDPLHPAGWGCPCSPFHRAAPRLEGEVTCPGSHRQRRVEGGHARRCVWC